MSSIEVIQASVFRTGRRVLQAATLGAIAVALLAVVACGQQAPAASKPAEAPKAAAPAVQTREIKVATASQPTSPFTIETNAMGERVKQRTNGAITFVAYPGNQLGSDRQAIEAMKMHTLGASISQNTAGNPVWDMTNGPFLFRDRDHMRNVMRGAVGEQWRQKFLQVEGVRMIANIYFAPRHITTSKPEGVKTPADLAGLKIRVPDQPIYVAMFKMFGANPVPIAFNELYTALQTKTVDGQENPIDVIYLNKFQEVQKSLSITGHIMSTMNFMMDEQVWQSFTPEQQKIVLEEARVVEDKVEATTVAKEAEYIQKIKEAGVNVVQADVNAFRDKVKDFWKDESVTKAWGPGVYDQVMAVK